MDTVQEQEEFIKEWLENDFTLILFSNPRKRNEFKKIAVRKILSKNKTLYQFEQFTQKQTFHKNVTKELLAAELAQCIILFKSIECTFKNYTELFLINSKGKIRSIKKSEDRRDPDESHNKTKHYIIPENTPVPFLVAQGIMNKDGKVLQKKYHKFRQINKFLEFIDTILPVLTAIKSDSIKITDFGCGKAYLSFALYYYLHEEKKLPISISGLDLKNEVIENCTALAKECNYTGLSFIPGDIAEYREPAHMVICLHACDTATDYALAHAIQNNTDIIFAVPCCQHEINTQLRKTKSVFKEARNDLYSMLEYGLITEKFAALLTDTLRAKILEAFGYSVQVMEFIDMEHTPKNTLIRAVKKEKDLVKIVNKKAFNEYLSLKNKFHLEPIIEKILIP